MRCKLCVLVGVASLALFAYAGSASALTLGIATPPGGGPTLQPCTSSPSPLIGQGTDDPNLPYHVPAGGGVITQWQTITSVDASGAAGAAVTFVVLQPTGTKSWTIVGADSENLPNPLPIDGIATYTLASPITAAAGDTLGLYSTNADVVCAFNGAATPVNGKVTPFTDLFLPPAVGQGVTAQPQTPPGWAMNEEATLVQTGDAAVTTSAGPSGVDPGQSAVLFSTVTNNGGAIDPIKFTDTVPSGLTIDSAVVGDGGCSVSGQTVTCTTAPLAFGQSVPVDVVVTPSADGNYTNAVSVANDSTVTDPNLANNAASTTLRVGPLPSPPPPPPVQPPPSAPPPTPPVLHCVVPPLKGIPASLAKVVLKDLNCKVKTTHVHSKSIHKGLVLKTRPGKGTYADEKTVKLVVSSGRKA
jgi:uncharacterized protein DUF11